LLRKRRKPFGGQPRQAMRSGKPLSLAITVLRHLVIARRHDEAISFPDSSMEIASADEKSASQ